MEGQKEDNHGDEVRVSTCGYRTNSLPLYSKRLTATSLDYYVVEHAGAEGIKQRAGVPTTVDHERQQRVKS